MSESTVSDKFQEEREALRLRVAELENRLANQELSRSTRNAGSEADGGIAQAILDSLPEAVLAAERTGRITYLNRRADNLLRVAAIGRHSDLQIESVLGESVASLSDLSVDGSVRYLLATIGDADLQVVVTAQRIRIGEAEVLYSCRELSDLSLVSDTKDQIAALHARIASQQKEMRDNQTHFQKFVEGLAASYLVFSNTADGTLTYVSPSVKSLLGYEVDEVVGRSWREFVDLRNPVNKPLEALDAERFSDVGTPEQQLVAATRHANGSTVILEITAIGVASSEVSGEIVNHGIARDITRRYQTEADLRKATVQLEEQVAIRTRELEASKRRYRSIVQDQTEFIIRWTPDETLTFTNDACRRYFGEAAATDLPGKALSAVHPDDLPRVRALIAGLTVDYPSDTNTHRVLLADGSLRWHQWTNRAIFDEDGTLVEYQSVGRDVTARREAELGLQRQQALLAHMGRVSTIGEMAAGLTHEIAQPVYAIGNYTRAIRNTLTRGGTDLLEQVQQWNEGIAASATRVQELIKRLRTFIRRGDPERVSDRLHSIVESTLELLEFELRESGTEITLVLCCEDPLINVERVQIQQVLINLTLNSIEAMAACPPGSGKITIATSIDGDIATLEFRDNGPGFGGGIEDMFETFFTSKPSGTGLGLAISRAIIEAHDGEITPVDCPDGAVLRITLPCRGIRGRKR